MTIKKLAEGAAGLKKGSVTQCVITYERPFIISNFILVDMAWIWLLMIDACLLFWSSQLAILIVLRPT